MDALVEPWLGADGQRAYYRQVGQFDYAYTDVLAEHYPNLDVPVLILWGDRDPWVDISVGHRLQRMIGHAELEPVHDAGHFAMLEASEPFIRSLESWLNQLRHS